MRNPENQEHKGGEQQEQEPEITQRIYVASLADYNNGNLHGTWIDANQTANEIHQQTSEMLDESRLPDAEEWAIHDYEGFGPLHLSEYENFETIARLAQGITEHGPAFAHWASLTGLSDETTIERFEDAYLGEWKSLNEYAEHILDDLGYIDELNKHIPASIHPYIYIDSPAFARDLELSGDIYTADSNDGGIYLFTSNI